MDLYLFQEAVDAYKYICDKYMTVYDRKGNAYTGLLYQQPSVYSSQVGRKYVHLRNCNGDIARYNIKTGEITV